MEKIRNEWFKHKHLLKTNYSDFAFEQDLPTGWFVKRALVVPEGEFTIPGICLKLPKLNERCLILDNSLPVYQPLTAPNVLPIPFLLPHGLDLRYFNTGDVRLGFSIHNYSEGDILTLYYECWKPEEVPDGGTDGQRI